MHPTHVALYARVSAAQQADAHTAGSQGAALRERVAADGLTVSAAMPFLDEGYRGATLVRPALERLRDQAGAVTRTGKTVWDRRVVWGRLKHPASQGAAACGTTRQEPRWPRLRTQRNRPVPPRRAVSTACVAIRSSRCEMGPGLGVPRPTGVSPACPALVRR